MVVEAFTLPFLSELRITIKFNEGMDVPSKRKDRFIESAFASPYEIMD